MLLSSGAFSSGVELLSLLFLSGVASQLGTNELVLHITLKSPSLEYSSGQNFKQVVLSSSDSIGFAK